MDVLIGADNYWTLVCDGESVRGLGLTAFVSQVGYLGSGPLHGTMTQNYLQFSLTFTAETTDFQHLYRMINCISFFVFGIGNWNRLRRGENIPPRPTSRRRLGFCKVATAKRSFKSFIRVRSIKIKSDPVRCQGLSLYTKLDRSSSSQPTNIISRSQGHGEKYLRGQHNFRRRNRTKSSSILHGGKQIMQMAKLPLQSWGFSLPSIEHQLKTDGLIETSIESKILGLRWNREMDTISV